MKFKKNKNGLSVCYSKNYPEFSWVDVKHEAQKQLEKYKQSKVYQDMLLKEKCVELLQNQIKSVKERENLLLSVIASITDDDFDIVNKKDMEKEKNENLH